MPVVVISVGTLSVAVPEAVMELGETVHVTPDGQPEIEGKLTGSVNPLYFAKWEKH